MELILRMESENMLLELYEKPSGERIKIIKYKNKNKQNIIEV